MFICPVCGLSLFPDANSLKCKNNHCFDVSKSGYVNLLTTAKHNPKNSGDNAEMVAARAQFLEKDFYLPLAEHIADTVKSANHKTVVDCGCGEGYYTFKIAKAVLDSSVFGIDISKHAVSHAAKAAKKHRMSNLKYAVASAFELPFAENSADVVVSVFAPVTNNEYARILKPHGTLIIACPESDHLFELKSFLYENPYKNKPNVYDLPDFKIYDSKRISFEIELFGHDVMNLFAMTPYFYKTPREAIKRLENLDRLKTLCDFSVIVYKLNG